MTAHANVNGTWRSGINWVKVGTTWKHPKGYVNVNGHWHQFQEGPEYVYHITKTTTNFNLHSAIGVPAFYDTIRVVIDQDKIVYSTNVNTPAFRLGNAYSGKTVIIENHGKIFGHGGGPAQAGGIALDVHEKSGKVDLYNYGGIFSGGGGGGNGGVGGGGKYSTQRYIGDERQPESGERFETRDGYYIAQPNGPEYILHWGGSVILRERGTYGKSRKVGEWTYYLGAYHSTAPGVDWHGVYRTRPKYQTIWHNTNGGAGGKGGMGRSYNTSVGQGTNGSRGGTNAGYGGGGGYGGAFGSAGFNGGRGENGNRTNGSAGTAGGRAGYGIEGHSKVNYRNTSGSIVGGQHG